MNHQTTSASSGSSTGRKLGEHWMLELSQCDAELLDDLEFVKQAAIKACDLARGTLLQVATNKFEPQGVSVVVLLAESHLSIHTWPEERYAGVDVFTCGESMTPEAACLFLKGEFHAQSHSIAKVDRGSAGFTADSFTSDDG